MGQYRKVNPRIWNDAKFMDLSDDAKLVFLNLLTHLDLTMVGAMKATMQGLAAAMRWNEARYRTAFSEVEARGMVLADHEAQYVELPNFLSHNRPQSPKQVLAWGHVLDLLPECESKDRLIERLRDCAASYGQHFLDAFDSVCSKPNGVTNGILFPKQYAKQKGELNGIQYAKPVAVSGAVTATGAEAVKQNPARAESEKQPLRWYTPFKDYIAKTWLADRGCTTTTAFRGEAHWVALGKLVRAAEADGNLTLDDLKAAWDAFLHSKETFIRRQGLSYFCNNFSSFLQPRAKETNDRLVESVSCHYCGNEGRVIDMPAQGFCWPWFQSHLNEEGGVPSRCICPAGGKFPTLPMMTTANVAEEARACS